MRKLYWRLREVVLLPPVGLAIIAIGLVSSVIGFIYWYGPALALYPLWQWVFVPDCPLFALLFTLSLGLILLGRRAPLYDALVTFGLIKYGIWTVFIWVVFWINTQGNFTAESVVMTIAHLGMILEGILLLSFLKMNWPMVIASAAWFGLSDWMDYGPFKTYPHFPTSIIPFGLVQWQTILVTFLLTGLFTYMAWRQHRAGERAPAVQAAGASSRKLSVAPETAHPPHASGKQAR